MIRRFGVLAALLVLSATGALAQSSYTRMQRADPQGKQLVLLMDKDRNGKVSKAEFMAFMSAEFDRLDVNHDGELDPNELAGLRVVPSKHPGGNSK